MTARASGRVMINSQDAGKDAEKGREVEEETDKYMYGTIAASLCGKRALLKYIYNLFSFFCLMLLFMLIYLFKEFISQSFSTNVDTNKMNFDTFLLSVWFLFQSSSMNLREKSHLLA